MKPSRISAKLERRDRTRDRIAEDQTRREHAAIEEGQTTVDDQYAGAPRPTESGPPCSTMDQETNAARAPTAPWAKVDHARGPVEHDDADGREHVGRSHREPRDEERREIRHDGLVRRCRSSSRRRARRRVPDLATSMHGRLRQELAVLDQRHRAGMVGVVPRTVADVPGRAEDVALEPFDRTQRRRHRLAVDLGGIHLQQGFGRDARRQIAGLREGVARIGLFWPYLSITASQFCMSGVSASAAFSSMSTVTLPSQYLPIARGKSRL